MEMVSLGVRKRSVGTYDPSTGEVLSQFESYEDINTLEARPWVKIYLDAWAVIKQVNGFSDVTKDVLYHMMCMYPDAMRKARTRARDGGEPLVPKITPTSDDKEYWAALMGTSVNVINNSISKLQKMGAISRVKRGSYIINPEIVGYGYESEMENLRAIAGTFRIDKDGASIEPMFEGEG